MRSMTLVLAIGLLGLMGFSTPSAAASFDCAKAATAIEKMVCATPALSARDAALGKLYAAALRSPKATQVRSDQRAWVEQEQKRCTDTTCLQEAYDARLSDLFYEGRAAAQTFQRTDRTGTLRILGAEGAWLAFSVSATWEGDRPGAVSTGAAAGVAQLTGGRMSYQSEDCKLAFTRTSPTEWRVTEASDCQLGLNVTLSGSYRGPG